MAQAHVPIRLRPLAHHPRRATTRRSPLPLSGGVVRVALCPDQILELAAAVRVIVTGSRSWSDRQRITLRLAQLPPEDDTVVVVGYDPEKKRPKGVDEIAYQEAQKLGLLVEPHPAHWDDEGKGAGFARNERMAKTGADQCIAFWDGRSHGTLDMMTRAVTHNIPVDVVMKR